MSLPSGRIDALAWTLESSANPAYAADRTGVIVFVNAAGRARWGEPATAGAAAATLFSVHTKAHLAEAVSLVLATDTATTFEAREDALAGDGAWASFAVSPLRDNEAVCGYLCVATDITALKRSEQRLQRSEQLMVDTQGVAHLGTWEWDISQPTAEWSDQLYLIYGLTRSHYTPSYEAYLTMVHPDDRERVVEATNRVFHEHVPYSHDERIFRPDGSLRYLHTWAYPVLDDAGALTRLVGVCQDITDRKMAEEEVNQLNAALERRVAERTRTIEDSLRDVEAFNATVSHDLRAPLSVISLSCTVISQSQSQGDPLPPVVIDSLARIRRSVAYMTELVNDLLALAHVGNAPIARSAIDLTRVAEEVVADLRLASPERAATIEIAPDLRCNADAGLMRAVMENLLGNAWKYSSRLPHAHLAVGIEEHDGRAVFFVRDNGAGFDMKEAHRLFAPFERLHKATEFEGTGVGLAAVQRIVERHGGRIWAHSEPGRGATFFFDVP